MLAAFLIMLREGVEAALVVGIVASYLKQTGRGGLMPAVWLGVLLALAASLFAGAGLQLASAEFPQKAQELFESLIGFSAVAVLTFMVFWMRKVSRALKGELHAGVDTALRRGGFALVGMVFLAVAREGLESVFFLLAIFEQSGDGAAPLGALLGLLAAGGVGYGLYAGGTRLDLRRFFRWTSLFILLVAAGMCAGSLKSLHEAGLWNHLQATAFDLSSVLPLDSPLGALLSAVLGYQETPSIGEVIAYIGYLVLASSAFLWQPGGPPRRLLAIGSEAGKAS